MQRNNCSWIKLNNNLTANCQNYRAQAACKYINYTNVDDHDIDRKSISSI